LTNGARAGGNLLALALMPRAPMATVGEMSATRWKRCGRHRAEIKAITGVYKAEAGAMSEAIVAGASHGRSL
jgi:methylmalonyl-CoA mutase